MIKTIFFTLLLISSINIANAEGALKEEVDTKLAKKGQQLFKQQCALCHYAKKTNRKKSGSNLINAYSNTIGSDKRYKYSKGIKTAKKNEVVVDAAFLDSYMINPRATVHGTKKSKRFQKPKERQAIIEYLKDIQQKNNTKNKE